MTRALYLSRHYKTIPSADPPDGVSMFALVREALRRTACACRRSGRWHAHAAVLPWNLRLVALIDEIKLILNPPPRSSAAARSCDADVQQSRARLSTAARPRRAANRATACRRADGAGAAADGVYSTRQPFSYS